MLMYLVIMYTVMSCTHTQLHLKYVYDVYINTIFPTWLRTTCKSHAPAFARNYSHIKYYRANLYALS